MGVDDTLRGGIGAVDAPMQHQGLAGARQLLHPGAIFSGQFVRASKPRQASVGVIKNPPPSPSSGFTLMLPAVACT